jgi:hypothetical protein
MGYAGARWRRTTRRSLFAAEPTASGAPPSSAAICCAIPTGSSASSRTRVSRPTCRAGAVTRAELVAIGDFNHDGRADLVATGWLPTASTCGCRRTRARWRRRFSDRSGSADHQARGQSRPVGLGLQPDTRRGRRHRRAIALGAGRDVERGQRAEHATREERRHSRRAVVALATTTAAPA